MTQNKDKDPFENNPRLKEKMEPGLLRDEGIHSIHQREKQEPTELMAPVPMIIIFVFFVFGFWGGMYLSRYSGNFRADVYDPEWKPTAAIQAEQAFDPIKQGTKLFARNCQQCHQKDGQGIPGVYPPLVGSEWVLGEDIRIVKLLLAGMSGTVTVKGQQFTGNMPNFAHWKDRDIAAVLTYVRQSWDNDAAPVAAELVTDTRVKMADRKKPWKPEELLAEHPF